MDVLIVVGSPNSSNSNRLREVGATLGIAAYMVDNASELKQEWFGGKVRVGLTAGASAPEILVQRVVERIKEFGAESVAPMEGLEENVVFSLPKGLA